MHRYAQLAGMAFDYTGPIHRWGLAPKYVVQPDSRHNIITVAPGDLSTATTTGNEENTDRQSFGPALLVCLHPGWGQRLAWSYP